MDILEQIKTPEQLEKFFISLQIEYDGHKNKHIRTPKEVLEQKKGDCWEIVELERVFFDKYFRPKLEYQSYFIINIDLDTRWDLRGQCCTHTFIVFDRDNKKYQFEYAWRKHAGIYKLGNDIFQDIFARFKDGNHIEDRHLKTFAVFEYNDIFELGYHQRDYVIIQNIIKGDPIAVYDPKKGERLL
jgi:hypothetical protein